MDSEKLKEIRNNIAVLPVLRERAEKLRTRIREAEREIETLLEKYRKECLDVEQLKNNSFSAFLLKIVGKYQGKLEKEEQEILAAKLEYDRTCQQAEEFKKELHELELRIIELKGQERIYETEIKKREQMLLSKMNTEASEQYTELNQEHEFIQKQLVEMDEAIRTANRAKALPEMYEILTKQKAGQTMMYGSRVEFSVTWQNMIILIGQRLILTACLHSLKS